MGIEKKMAAIAFLIPVMTARILQINGKSIQRGKRRSSLGYINFRSILNVQNMISWDRVAMGNAVKNSFGAVSGVMIFGVRGIAEVNAVKAGKVKVNTSTGNLSRTGTVSIPPSRHYGEV